MNRKIGKHISGTLRPEQKEWIDDMIAKGEFHNMSHALQRSIIVTKRLYEYGTNEEKIKFLFGRGIK